MLDTGVDGFIEDKQLEWLKETLVVAKKKPVVNLLFVGITLSLVEGTTEQHGHWLTNYTH